MRSVAANSGGLYQCSCQVVVLLAQLACCFFFLASKFNNWSRCFLSFQYKLAASVANNPPPPPLQNLLSPLYVVHDSGSTGYWPCRPPFSLPGQTEVCPGVWSYLVSRCPECVFSPGTYGQKRAAVIFLLNISQLLEQTLGAAGKRNIVHWEHFHYVVNRMQSCQKRAIEASCRAGTKQANAGNRQVIPDFGIPLLLPSKMAVMLFMWTRSRKSPHTSVSVWCNAPKHRKECFLHDNRLVMINVLYTKIYSAHPFPFSYRPLQLHMDRSETSIWPFLEKLQMCFCRKSSMFPNNEDICSVHILAPKPKTDPPPPTQMLGEGSCCTKWKSSNILGFFVHEWRENRA